MGRPPLPPGKYLFVHQDPSRYRKPGDKSSVPQPLPPAASLSQAEPVERKPRRPNRGGWIHLDPSVPVSDPRYRILPVYTPGVPQLAEVTLASEQQRPSKTKKAPKVVTVKLEPEPDCITWASDNRHAEVAAQSVENRTIVTTVRSKRAPSSRKAKPKKTIVKLEDPSPSLSYRLVPVKWDKNRQADSDQCNPGDSYRWSKSEKIQPSSSPAAVHYHPYWREIRPPPLTPSPTPEMEEVKISRERMRKKTFFEVVLNPV
ncbi:hypothetical protein BDN70DRAFT_918796 [Pholiota conissans]|uniref:Uncharacterized protein n=1 Tax=Pholiota conissans TaxID=109636 RepID=A0A9P6D4Q3_9AGAR|nr:hypothetical protein BDN70DRAFT_918796 [Pholiota conissans]